MECDSFVCTFARPLSVVSMLAQTMCNMLAASRSGEPTGGAPAKLSLADVVALAPLLPLNTAFQLLTKPLLDRGIGLRLKRAHAVSSTCPHTARAAAVCGIAGSVARSHARI